MPGLSLCSGCHKSDSPVHHREVLDKRSIPDLNHSSALCAASYCHLRWSCARHVIRYACRVFLVGEPAWLPPRGSAEWAICYQLCRLPQFCGALSAAAERESRSTLSLLPSGTRHHSTMIWRIRSSINCCRIVPSCPQVTFRHRLCDCINRFIGFASINFVLPASRLGVFGKEVIDSSTIIK